MAALISLLVVGYTGYCVWHIHSLAQLSRPAVAEAHAFEREEPSMPRRILILGDSTAVGVGSPAALSVAGRLSNEFSASVENYGKSGAVTADLDGQINSAKKDRFDLILIQIGANDVINFYSLKNSAKMLDAALIKLHSRADRIAILTAGNIGNAPLFPWPVSWAMTYRTQILRELFMATAEKNDAVYVDIFSQPDIFPSNPSKYYAPDMLHPSGEGYGYWFSIVKKYVEKKWPELATNK